MGKIITRRVDVKVEFHHVDMMQVVHNSHYFRWFELGRMKILEDVFPMSWAMENKIATPVVMNHCDYLWPATYGDDLIVTTRHRKVDLWEGRFLYEHSISNRKTKVVLCNGQSAVTVVDMGTARLVKEIPTDVWARYLALE